jgi:ketosteroid isomerase-like protein
MKKLCSSTIIVTLLLSFLGCQNKQSNQLTEQKKEQIKNEVKTVLDSIIAKTNKPDMEGFLQYYSPELVCVIDTSIGGYQDYKKGWLSFPNNMNSWRWTTYWINCTVLTKDLVVSDWYGKMELYLKSGEKITDDPRNFTNVFKRVNGRWEVIYEHAPGILSKEKSKMK